MLRNINNYTSDTTAITATKTSHIIDDVNKAIYFAALGGLFLGLSVFAHPTSVILIPGFIIYSIFSMKHNKTSLLSFLVTLAIALLFVAYVNYLKFGSFTEFGYGYFSTLAAHSGTIGLVGLFFSPGAGLIFYFPLTILLPLAYRYLYRKNRGLFFLSLYVIFANWLDLGTLVGGPFAWWGTGWGPRYFVVILPFLTIVSGTLLLQLRTLSCAKKLFLNLSIIILCSVGFYISLTGTLVWWQYGFIYGWDKEHLGSSVDYVNIMTWNPYYSPIILHTKALLSNYIGHTLLLNNTQIYRATSWWWAYYALAPCPYDLYIYCKFGTMPFLLLCLVIAALAMLILMKVIKFNPKIRYSWPK